MTTTPFHFEVGPPNFNTVEEDLAKTLRSFAHCLARVKSPFDGAVSDLLAAALLPTRKAA